MSGGSVEVWAEVGASKSLESQNLPTRWRPVASKGRLVRHVGRILRPHPGKGTAEVKEYHDGDAGWSSDGRRSQKYSGWSIMVGGSPEDSFGGNTG